LRTKKRIAQEEESAQLAARVALESATAESVKATDEAHRLASDTVKIIVGLADKNDLLVHRLRNLRDETKNEVVRRPRNT